MNSKEQLNLSEVKNPGSAAHYLRRSSWYENLAARRESIWQSDCICQKAAQSVENQHPARFSKQL